MWARRPFPMAVELPGKEELLQPQPLPSWPPFRLPPHWARRAAQATKAAGEPRGEGPTPGRPLAELGDFRPETRSAD